MKKQNLGQFMSFNLEKQSNLISPQSCNTSRNSKNFGLTSMEQKSKEINFNQTQPFAINSTIHVNNSEKDLQMNIDSFNNITSQCLNMVNMKNMTDDFNQQVEKASKFQKRYILSNYLTSQMNKEN